MNVFDSFIGRPSDDAAPTGQPQGFRLSFGAEELAVLVQSLGGDALMGLGESPLANLSPREKTLITQAATHSLLARGYLAPLEDGEVGIDDAVRKIITIALHPRHIITQIHRSSEQVAALFHYLGAEQLAIAHQTHLGAHFLDVTFQWPDFPAMIGAQLAPYLPPSETSRATLLPTAVLRQVKSLVQEDAKAEAAGLLFQHEFPRQDGMAFLDALARPQFTWHIHIASWQGRDLGPYENALTILCGDRGCWGVQGEGAGDASGMAVVYGMTQAALNRFFAPVMSRA